MHASDLEAIVQAGTPLTREQAETLLASPDLVGVGLLGEMARHAASADRVSYGRVCVVSDAAPADVGDAGEVRIVTVPASVDDARRIVRTVSGAAGTIPLTGFSLGDLLALTGSDHLALADLAHALHDDGLAAVGEAALDTLGDTDNAIEVVRAAVHGGLAVPRATIARASIDQRLDLVERAAAIQRETGAFKAFAPLPRVDPADSPATGYDDVRTIAIARLMCRSIPLIQVDWPLYGPKLAQVALTYGADDIDGVSAADTLGLGWRRAPREDVERNIRAAGQEPALRSGRFTLG